MERDFEIILKNVNYNFLYNNLLRIPAMRKCQSIACRSSSFIHYLMDLFGTTNCSAHKFRNVNEYKIVALLSSYFQMYKLWRRWGRWGTNIYKSCVPSRIYLTKKKYIGYTAFYLLYKLSVVPNVFLAMFHARLVETCLITPICRKILFNEFPYVLRARMHHISQRYEGIINGAHSHENEQE